MTGLKAKGMMMLDDDRIEEIFRDALRRKAESAPVEHGLATRIRARLARRRRRQVAGATVACLAVVAGFVGFAQVDDSPDNGYRAVERPDRESDPVPGDWRWESYGGIEVAVPPSWGYGTTGQPPCLRVGHDAPYIGRPGFVPSVGCSEPTPPMRWRMPYLWFDDLFEPTGVRTYDHGWAAETRIVGGVAITVFADDAGLRRRVLDSARVTSEIDTHGCPVDDPIIDGPGIRPVADGGLATVDTVEFVSVCRYAFDDSMTNRTPQPLLSSSRLTGDAASAVVAEILASPEGSGPNDPEHCAPQAMYGDEAIVLRVHGRTNVPIVEAYLRYGGCDGHGTDDGVMRRQLTEHLLDLVLVGPHEPPVL